MYGAVFDQDSIEGHIRHLDQQAALNQIACWRSWAEERAMWEKKNEQLRAWKDAWPQEQDILSHIWSDIFGAKDVSCDHIILDIQTGGGGTEAFFWVTHLSGLFEGWAKGLGCASEIMSTTQSSCIIRFEGRNARMLASQEGTHRFVRQSPFDKNKKTHTSFVTVRASFDVAEKDMDIHRKDIRIDTMRSQGAGGQHVNTTESAVRITHLPTGISVVCQNGRSQHSNKKTAWAILMQRLKDDEGDKGVRVKPERKSKSYTYHFGRNEVIHHGTNRVIRDVESYLSGKTPLRNLLKE